MTLQQIKSNHILTKKYKYDEGVMTRGEWIRLQHSKGAYVFEHKQHNEAAEDKLRLHIDFLRRTAPTGNECHPLTKELISERQRLEQGIFKTMYGLQKPNVSWFTEITKTEFDYFNSIS
jgi:hypothetical protein